MRKWQGYQEKPVKPVKPESSLFSPQGSMINTRRYSAQPPGEQPELGFKQV